MEVVVDLDALLERSRVNRSLPKLRKPAARRLIRVRARLSQSEVAAAFGVDPPTVSRWETGRRTPGGARLQAYAELLDRLAAER